MDPTNAQLSALDSRESRNYGDSPLDSKKDRMIGSFIHLIKSGTDLHYAIELAKQKARWDALDTYAARMASLAVRNRDSQALRDGLVAALIAMKSTDDQRDVLPTLSILYRAWELVADKNIAFRAQRELEVGETEDPLIEFGRRSPDERRIQAMGYHEGSDSEGFRFVDR
ncbi:hypothetical protein [Embleya sp. MST-111070]|uniref:hypothetical protein n=1 Tax=Embleya sp. MST-111070 TaxID=3398231 RepID=UPI003F736858